jgi:hypothetical protein
MGAAAALIPGIVGIGAGEYMKRQEAEKGREMQARQASAIGRFLDPASDVAGMSPFGTRGPMPANPNVMDGEATRRAQAAQSPQGTMARFAREMLAAGNSAPANALVQQRFASPAQQEFTNIYSPKTRESRSYPKGMQLPDGFIDIGDKAPPEAPKMTMDDKWLEVAGGDVEKAVRMKAAAESSGQPNRPSAPAGYTFQPDGSLVPMVGGPADEKRKGLIAADRATIRATSQSADRAISAIDGVLNSKDLSRVLGPFDARFPALTEKTGKIQGEIDNIKSRIVVDVMNALKAGSTNGSTGFGALSEKEMYVLQNAVAAMNQVTTVDGFKEQLNTLKQFLSQTKTNLRQKYSEEYGVEFQDANQKMVDY